MSKIKNISYEKIVSIKIVKTDYTYDFAVKDKHRIIAKNEGSLNAFYTSNCWHPDIEEFITAKQTPGRLTKFNMSVLVTDELMDAVKNNKPWNLEFPDYENYPEEYKNFWDGDIKQWKEMGLPTVIYKTYDNANQLWDLIMSSTYNRNEPGVLFIDTINKLNNLQYCEHINATNPCLTGDSIITCSDNHENFEKLKLEQAIEIAWMEQSGELILFGIKLKDLVTLYKNNPSLVPQILSYNEDIKDVEWKDMTWGDLTQKDAELLEIELEDGRKLKLTPDHKVFTLNRGWVMAKDLTDDDQLL